MNKHEKRIKFCMLCDDLLDEQGYLRAGDKPTIDDYKRLDASMLSSLYGSCLLGLNKDDKRY